jgi:IS30 family transposase
MGCKYQQLSKGDRIKIHTLLFCNKTQKEIAQELKVHPSDVSLNNRPQKIFKI